MKYVGASPTKWDQHTYHIQCLQSLLPVDETLPTILHSHFYGNVIYIYVKLQLSSVGELELHSYVYIGSLTSV